jgi:hypothetical protein
VAHKGLRPSIIPAGGEKKQSERGAAHEYLTGVPRTALFIDL